MRRTRSLRIPWSRLTVTIYIIFVFWHNDYTYPLKDAPQGAYGRPAVSDEYSHLDLPIWQVADDGDRVYVLCDSYGSIVQVYDMNGNYEKTLFFQQLLDKGKFQIATEEHTLYVQDEKGNVYVFQHGEFSCFLEKTDANRALSHIDFRIRDSSSGYIVKGDSVWRVADPENICIIEGKSLLALIAESPVVVLAGLVCIFLTKYLERRGL